MQEARRRFYLVSIRQNISNKQSFATARDPDVPADVHSLVSVQRRAKLSLPIL